MRVHTCSGGIGALHSVRAAFVSDEFFEVLGVPAGIGRTLRRVHAWPAGVMLSRRAASRRRAWITQALLGRQLNDRGS